MVQQIHNHDKTSEYGSAVYCCGCPNPQADRPVWEDTVEPHVHVTKSGALVQCYHQCRNALTSAGFWAGLTLGFPVEHFLYEKVWPFKLLTHWMGL